MNDNLSSVTTEVTRNVSGCDPALNLCVGEIVEVRSESEILSALDEPGTLEALPFMPEMREYCGRRFRVFKRADKTCDTIKNTGLRQMKNAVHLEGVRCDGAAHGGCQATCLIFWKEAWLRRVRPAPAGESSMTAGCPGQLVDKGDSRILPTFLSTARTKTDLANPEDEAFSCQATELRNATTRLRWWDIRQYVRDISSGNVSAFVVIRGLLFYMFNYLQAVLGGTQFPRLGGTLKKTPKQLLNLQPGELVQVKTKEEILQTLDAHNSNRGLGFNGEMLRYCGKTFRVQKRVQRIINEKTGKMMNLPNDCIILEGVICVGDYHKFCPRSIYPYWREIWLRRIEPGNASVTNCFPVETDVLRNL